MPRATDAQVSAWIEAGKTPPTPAATTELTIVCGLDLSLTATGVAHVIGGQVITDTVRSKGHRADDYDARGLRLRDLRARIVEAVGVRPHLIVVETPAFASNTGSAFDRAGLWWSVVSVLQARGHRIAYMAPKARATYLTGKGNADKLTVVAEVARRFPHLTINDDNECDALGLACAGADWLGYPVVDLPQTHRRALAKVEWPQGVAA